jgi:hypothetical protein
MSRFLSFLCVFVIVPLAKVLATVPVLFLVYNAGEAEPFREVAKKLTVDYKIVGIGVGEEKFGKDPYFVSIGSDPFADEKSTIPTHDTDQNRDRLLNDATLQKILSLDPQVVVSGMAAAWQAQVLNAARQKGAKTVAFYDNMNGPVTEQQYVGPFMSTIQEGAVGTWLVPGDAFKVGFEGNVKALGQPVLEQWDTVFASPDAKIKDSLGMKDEQRLILFAGGNDVTYPQYLEEMMKAVKYRQDLFLVVTPHPARKDGAEDTIFEKLGNPVNIRVERNIKTIDIAPFISVFAAHKSSMGAHALSHGLPVLFVGPKADYASLVVVGDGLGVVAETQDEVKKSLEALLKSEQKPSLEKLGVPSNASQAIADFLVQESQ